MKAVRVIIPAYNRASAIKRAIDGVRSQTFRNIKNTLMDDGATDNTQKIVAAKSEERKLPGGLHYGLRALALAPWMSPKRYGNIIRAECDFLPSIKSIAKHVTRPADYQSHA